MVRVIPSLTYIKFNNSAQEVNNTNKYESTHAKNHTKGSPVNRVDKKLHECKVVVE